jgi:hypothetical protein
MKAGFGRADITPRVGVELSGFGPFLCRHSIGIRDRLWARAVAFEEKGRTVLLISCDLIGVTLAITEQVRARIRTRAGLDDDAILVCATHTHSGPNTGRTSAGAPPTNPIWKRCPTACPGRVGRASVASTGPPLFRLSALPGRGLESGI